MRIGMGYDLHRFSENRKLILGGVEVSYQLGLVGHSDADVLCHAISDAILGAAALGDIGKHFPDDDPQYKNADSLALLAECASMVRQKGFKLVNIDATVIMERPKIASHINTMRRNIASSAGIVMDVVSVKATTNEAQDSCGRGEAAAAYAVVLLR
jgi:2-C-methyl-D-erythritol 2,4-cyclodiphosphate synthase